MITAKPLTVDEYINSFPEATQRVLEKVRATVSKSAPGAEETISYAIPTFKLNGKALVHFAAFKSHIGFYAAPTGTEAFKKEFAGYKTGRGSVQFPLDQPMPLALIKRIVEYRVKEIRMQGTAKKK
jgi:uncharacterized protein YdhG (YjbR/CyaY superfamily)